jgi:large repetitive protein
MGFSLNPVQGTPAELGSDLESPPKHEREEVVVEVIKSSIEDIVNSLGGYLSVAASGNINQVSGETGDVVNIYITSLPAPGSTTPPPAETPAEVAPAEGIPVAPEIPVVETAPPTEVGTEPVPVQETPVVEPIPPPVQTETAPTPETPVVEIPVVTPLETPVVEVPPAGEVGQELPQVNETPSVVEVPVTPPSEGIPIGPETLPVNPEAPVAETATGASPIAPVPVIEPTPAEIAPEGASIPPSPETITTPETVEGTVVLEPGDKVV